MKKIYEAPALEELYADAPAVMADVLTGSAGDQSGSDLDWDLI